MGFGIITTSTSIAANTRKIFRMNENIVLVYQDFENRKPRSISAQPPTNSIMVFSMAPETGVLAVLRVVVRGLGVGVGVAL
jgi:hypothetical protein